MLPGPDYFYKCPSCGNLLKRGSLTSGNTFGAKIFSDGKRVAPMLPEYPNLTKCKKCKSIFWLSKLKEIGTSESDDNNNLQSRNADKAVFLEIEDYFRALDSGAAENKQEELFIRLRIWWSYNDRTRASKEIFEDSDDELRWEQNVNKLLSLLNQSDINEKIMIAEINRNLGNFEKCIDIIQSLKNTDLEWLKRKFLDECNQKNRWVIELN